MEQGIKPVLGITMGDPTGAGPEIIVRALCSPEVRGRFKAVIIGDAAAMDAAVKIVAIPAAIKVISNAGEARFEDGVIEVIDLKNVDMAALVRGRVHPMGGAVAYACIEAATGLALKEEIAAVVTAPLNKEALNKAGHNFSGHTEILAHLCGVNNVVMMLAARDLRIAHVTTHVSLRQACDQITKERILHVLRLTDKAVRQMGIAEPRLVVSGLNPHAGEHGLFGSEEAERIIPAIETAREEGLNVTGPLPPDTVFLRASRGEFDAALAMYHDQGHIPIKMLAFDEGVNVTLGLPIIRTSVDHGTVFGKAGKGTANPRSMIESIKLADRMSGG
ncbi:4-hydroxythreonine-4-phosphate dehydrogenase PdxA [Chloroflexota bacterium]